MSANLISSMRTGAVPGVATRYLVREESEVCSVIGCGPINKSCYRAVMSQLKNVKKIVCFDLFQEKAQEFVDWAIEEYGLEEGYTVETAEEAVKAGDVITVAASRLKPLHIDSSWVKKDLQFFFQVLQKEMICCGKTAVLFMIMFLFMMHMSKKLLLREIKQDITAELSADQYIRLLMKEKLLLFLNLPVLAKL